MSFTNFYRVPRAEDLPCEYVAMATGSTSTLLIEHGSTGPDLFAVNYSSTYHSLAWSDLSSSFHLFASIPFRPTFLFVQTIN